MQGVHDDSLGWYVQKVRQAENNLTDHSALQQKELDSWRSNCEKLTASLSRKELELQTYTKRLQDLEDEVHIYSYI